MSISRAASRMPLTRVSPRSFLSSAKTALQNAIQHSLPVTFIIGNESADLDSLCSAIVLAYLRTHAHFPSQRTNTLYIPVSNLPLADLLLRPELVTVLKHADLKISDLITLSDLPFSSPSPSTSSPQQGSRLPPEKTNWILVDHNALQGELGERYGNQVRGCIDHHGEENRVPRETGVEPRIVRKSGSCASLVVEYCRRAWDELTAGSTASNDEFRKWDAGLARLALAPVLIDTTNLTVESKTTDSDRDAAAYLHARISAVEEGFDSDRYFEEVTKAKENIGGLSLKDILRKDYKQWNEGGEVNLGVSSVVKDIEFLIQQAGHKDAFLSTVQDFARERDLLVHSIMTTSSSNGVFQRELLVWGFNERGVEAARKFEEKTREELGLEMWKQGSLDLVEEGSWRRCWRQGKVEHSRKQVAPLLREASI